MKTTHFCRVAHRETSEAKPEKQTRVALCLLVSALMSVSGCATPKRDLDFERLNTQWIESGRLNPDDVALAPLLAAEVDRTIAQWKLAQNKAARAQSAYLAERKIAVFQAGVALAKDVAKLAVLAAEKRDLELAAVKAQAQASQLEAERLRLQNLLQAEAAELALADERARAQAQAQAAQLETAAQAALVAQARKEADLARDLAAAQAHEAELARREAQLRGEQVATLEQQVAGLREVKSARGKSLVLGDAFFASNQGTLSNAGKANLTPVVAFLARYPDLAVSIEGHSDGKGAVLGNQKISLQRANSVRDALIKLGVSATRLKAVGFGESQPIASNDSDAGRAKNRRVEVVIEGAK
jgi:outer membrane protein OmpA-like peptidoglycan-associated protein